MKFSESQKQWMIRIVIVSVDPDNKLTKIQIN